jgi:alpha-galactosidase
MYLSLCEWGTNKPWLWAGEFAQSWRTTGDIQNNFNSVLGILDLQNGLRKYAGPGHWNDPDMLEVGNGMPVNEDRAHFSMWCMLAAPLILGNDIRHMSKETADIIMNKEVIAVDQDRLGIEGLRYAKENDLEFWFKPLEGGDWAFCILNRGTQPEKYTIDWQKFNFTDDLSKCATHFDQKTYSIRNLWTRKKEGTSKKTKKVVIPGHDVLMYRLTPKK